MAEFWEASCELEANGSSEAGGWLPDSAARPAVDRILVRLRIVHTDDGYFLYSESDSSRFFDSDTCHESAADAMAQAEYQFNIPRHRWQRVAA
jgi:hypothetical protein